MFAVLLLCLTASPVLGSSSSGGGGVFDIELTPTAGKWMHCLDNGWANLRWSVHASAKLTSGVQLPGAAQACQPSKPSSCKWLASCDSAQDCSKFFPAELSGRKKCVVVVNTLGSPRTSATVQIQLESPGNRGAIIFGVALSSFGLLAVVAAGCYSDLKKLKAGDKRRQRTRQPALPTPQAATRTLNGHA